MFTKQVSPSKQTLHTLLSSVYLMQQVVMLSLPVQLSRMHPYAQLVEVPMSPALAVPAASCASSPCAQEAAFHPACRALVMLVLSSFESRQASPFWSVQESTTSKDWCYHHALGTFNMLLLPEFST